MSQLAKIFGKENFSNAELDLFAYSTDASQIKGKAAAIVYPLEAEQVRQVVRYAARTKLDLVARGAGTNLVGSAVPNKSIVVDFSRMNRIKSINVKNKMVVVEPGVVLAELNSWLKRFSLAFPVRPSSERVCTIGGMIATNAAGGFALSCGKTADWVEALEIIDGTGKQFTLKGGDVKDFAGSEGTLGMIVEARLRLSAPKSIVSMDVYTAESTVSAIDTVKQLKNSSAVSIEFLDKLAAGLAGLEEKNYIFVAYEDESGNIKSQADIKRFQDIRDSAYPVLASNSYSIIEDPEIELHKLGELIDWLQANGIPSFGHIGIGILHPCFKDSSKLQELYSLVRKLSGNVSGEHGIGLKKRHFISKEYSERVSRLKKRFDPDSLLNRGKVL